MKKPELLAPAGNPEKLRTAVHYGADAVYLGDSRFSLRGKAGNFDRDGVREAVAFAHNSGVKAYITVNIFPHNRDLGELADYIEFLKDIMPDAVILSDPGLFSMFREKAPDLDLHISTQANVTNIASAQFWERLGARRLVLSRELSVDEIREIRAETRIELEVFVHGSLCISYSGRCYISSFLASRSANRGECTNSCRWNYTLMEEKRPGEYFPVFEDDRGTYIMSSRDLCLIKYLPLLVAAGVDSFKIEGRMKGINYVAGVVKAYREAIDLIDGKREYRVDPRILRELSMFSSRGYTTGMFFGKQPDDAYNFDGEGYRMTHEMVGVVLDRRGTTARVALRHRLNACDQLEFLSPGIEEKVFRAGPFRDEEGTAVTSARNEDIIYLEVPPEVRANDLVRRRKTKGSADNSPLQPEGGRMC